MSVITLIFFEKQKLMLTSLSIKNFALIDDLFVNFSEGFSIITGETGAGKSILLGGLALILGKRADLSSLKDDKKKLISGDTSISFCWAAIMLLNNKIFNVLKKLPSKWVIS